MVTLDMCFQMQRAKEYWDWRNPNDSFHIIHADLLDLGIVDFEDKYRFNFNPEEWCPVGTVEFVETYLRTYFGDKIANKAVKPLNVPTCFLDNKMNTGRQIKNYFLSKSMFEDIWDDNEDKEFFIDGKDAKYFIKDEDHIKNPNNGIMTLQEAYDKGLRFVECSQLIKEGHNSSEWRAFIHNGKVVDIKHYAGDPFVFPDMDTVINSYMYQLENTLKEGTLDVYVDEMDGETYVMECHKFFSCGLYGFDHPDILPIMYWRTFLELIKV